MIEKQGLFSHNNAGNGAYSVVCGCDRRVCANLDPHGACAVHAGAFRRYGFSIVLETKLAVCLQLVYILLGAVGAPMFAGFQGGLHRILGPTGGFLASYILMALVIGRILAKSSEYSFKRAFLANAAGLLPCYLLGALWLGFSMNLTFRQTLMSAVLPFIPLDLVKAGITAAAGKRLRAALKTVSR